MQFPSIKSNCGYSPDSVFFFNPVCILELLKWPHSLRIRFIHKQTKTALRHYLPRFVLRYSLDGEAAMTPLKVVSARITPFVPDHVRDKDGFESLPKICWKKTTQGFNQLMH